MAPIPTMRICTSNSFALEKLWHVRHDLKFMWNNYALENKCFLVLACCFELVALILNSMCFVDYNSRQFIGESFYRKKVIYDWKGTGRLIRKNIYYYLGKHVFLKRVRLFSPKLAKLGNYNGKEASFILQRRRLMYVLFINIYYASVINK